MHTHTHTHVAGDLGGASLSAFCGRIPLSQWLHSLHVLLALGLCQLEESTKGQKKVYLTGRGEAGGYASSPLAIGLSHGVAPLPH